MSLRVGKVIYSLLTNNKKITDKVNKKIYPLIADDDVTFPFIVYKRTGIDIITSKDKYINKEEAMVEIIVATDKYEESINIASDVKDELQGKRGNIAGIAVKDITLDSADEDFIEDTFIQRLNFKIEIK